MSAVRTIDIIKRDIDRLANVHPDLRDRVLILMQTMESLGFPMFVTQGVRTPKEQQALYAQGRTTPGKIVTYKDGINTPSEHQAKSDGFGHAVDCAFIDDPDTPKSEVFEAGPKWQAFGACAEALGLTWGGRWKMADLPHVELR